MLPGLTRAERITARKELRNVAHHDALDWTEAAADQEGLEHKIRVPDLPSTSPLLCLNEEFHISDAAAIAACCSDWIKRVKDLHLAEAYRIQLVRDVAHDCWRLELCLEPLGWFDLRRKQYGDHDALKCAQDYIVYCEQGHVPTTATTRDKASSGRCKFDQDIKGCPDPQCKFLHVLWECQHQVQLRDSQAQRKCHFPTYVEDLLADGTCWALHRRYREGTRELLLMPKPDVIEKGHVPHGNVQLVQKPVFWAVALAEAHELDNLLAAEAAVERIVINFGAWETAERQDPNLRECHAHAHLWFTKTFLTGAAHSPLVANLGNCYATPEDYLRKNAEELQNRRIIPLRFDRIELQLGQIELQIGQILTILRAPMTAVVTQKKRCSSCHSQKEETAYSKKQWKLSDAARRCQSCIGKM